VDATLQPVWNESFDFDYDTVLDPGLGAVVMFGLYLSVWDEDALSADDFLGELFIDPRQFIDLPVNETFTTWYPLQSNTRAWRATRGVLGAQRSESGDYDVQRAQASEEEETSLRLPAGSSATVGESGRIMIGFKWNSLELSHHDHAFRMRVDIPAIGVSLLQNKADASAAAASSSLAHHGHEHASSKHAQLAELLFVTLSCIHLDYATSSSEMKLWFTVDNLQIDNQAGAATFPVLLATARHNETLPRPLLQLCCVKDTSYNISAHAHESEVADSGSVSVSASSVALVDFYKYASVLIQELQLKVELDTVLEIIDVVQEIRTALASSDEDVKAILSGM
jgi:hypothetical protein